MLVRKAAHEVAGVELELCLRTVIVCVDDDGPKLLALESVLIAETHWPAAHRGLEAVAGRLSVKQAGSSESTEEDTST